MTCIHRVELDHSSSSSEESGKHALLIWPATALAFDRRYIVAIRSFNHPSGVPRTPSVAFQALRDGKAPESRQLHYDEIFKTLAEYGVEKEDLLLAWDFTTNDKADVTGRLVTARDDMTERVGEDGPRYRIGTVEYDTDELVGKKIKGQFEMPLYLNTHLPEKTARLVLDENALPVFQGYAWFDFEVIVPTSYVDSPGSAGILQYGHGLFGSYEEVEYGSSGYLHEDATNYGYVLAASTWLGLSAQDIPAVGSILVNDLSDFQYIPDRNVQGKIATKLVSLISVHHYITRDVTGIINALGLMKMMKGKFSRDPEMLTTSGLPILNTDKRAYFGNSCGGIMGTVYMAATQDVQRGLIGVPGGPFGLILPRSLDYKIEFAVLKARYRDPVDAIMLEQIMQMLWDRSEPAGFMSSVTVDPLPSTKSHEVLLHYGLADAQVSSLSSHALSRSTNAVMYASNAKEHDESFFGFDLLEDDDVVTGRSAIQGFDFKSDPIPDINKPPAKEGDTHEMPRRDSRAQEQMGHFFLTGEIINTCGGSCISDPIE